MFNGKGRLLTSPSKFRIEFKELLVECFQMNFKPKRYIRFSVKTTFENTRNQQDYTKRSIVSIFRMVTISPV